ncbi:hypothetical protein [Salinispora arenicola]|uniref:hypothetical protein n=1 Tax=Salinispora arenicola TaxID=168697 RepID=UPI000360F950|nr:hypothetical protein [Salinispora arenicola]
MPDNATGTGSARPVWRRAAASPPGEAAPTDQSDRPLRCGGRELSVHERFNLMRERRRLQVAEQERQREESEERDSAVEERSTDEEEDEDRAAERFRNDRYAVKLLHQDSAAWGGDMDSGTLG